MRVGIRRWARACLLGPLVLLPGAFASSRAPQATSEPESNRVAVCTARKRTAGNVLLLETAHRASRVINMLVVQNITDSALGSACIRRPRLKNNNRRRRWHQVNGCSGQDVAEGARKGLSSSQGGRARVTLQRPSDFTRARPAGAVDTTARIFAAAFGLAVKGTQRQAATPHLSRLRYAVTLCV